MAVKLDDAQRKAVAAHGNVLISACPGSGKTSTLAARGALLLKTGTGKLAAVSFTKDSAEELAERIGHEFGGDRKARIMSGTFHSLAISQWKAAEKAGHVPKEKLRIATAFEISQAVMTAISQVDTGGEQLKFEDSARAIESMKSQLSGSPSKDMSDLLYHYNKCLRSMGVVDFADLLLRVVQGMRDGSVQPLGARWMMVDEGQDLDEVQLGWVEEHLKKGVEVTLVGDDDQCHPPGVMIRCRDAVIPVEKLSSQEVCFVSAGNEEDKTRRTDIRKLYLHDGGVADVAVRDFKGKLITVEAGGNQVPVTPNHRLVVRVNASYANHYVLVLHVFGSGWVDIRMTELMPRGDSFGPASMMSVGGPRQAWILDSFQSNKEAKAARQKLCLKYGFVKSIYRFMPEAALEESVVKSNIERAKKCLAEYGLDFGLPLLDEVMSKRGNRPFEIYSGSARTNLFEVPVVSGGGIVWEEIKSLSARNYSGPVYSLKVRPHPLYLANNIVVHNSIYEWRNALGFEGMRRFEETAKAEHVVLGRCYRCPDEVLMPAAELIRRNSIRRDKNIRSAIGKGGTVRVEHFPTRKDEYMALCDEIANDPGSWAVVGRVNYYLRDAMSVMQECGIPYRSGIDTSIWDKDEVKAFCGLMESLKDDVPSKVIEALVTAGIYGTQTPLLATLQKFRSASRMVAWMGGDGKDDCIAAAAKKKSTLNEFLKLWGGWRSMAAATPPRVASLATACSEWMLVEPKAAAARKAKEEGGVEKFFSISTAASILTKLEGSLVERINAAKRYAEESKSRNAPGRVQVLSLHGSKGLEFDNVWMINAEAGIIPATGSPIEEERRLFYVGMTRAKKNLVLTYALGANGLTLPSQFLMEAGLEAGRNLKDVKREVDRFDGPIQEYAIDVREEVDELGLGDQR